MNLFYREFGGGHPLVILHGLLGSSDNWVTLGKIFAEDFRVIIIDQRNHGQSFHSDTFDYESLVEDLALFAEEQSIAPFSLIGHSMGGKAAMKFALENPDQIDKLVVADMAPKSYKMDYDLIFQALNAVDLDSLKSRGEAEQIVATYIEDFTMRQFLLKNLSREGDGYRWKANLEVIQKNILNMGLWSHSGTSFDAPTLFINGGQSGYIKTDDEETIKELFPNSSRVTLDAGHWLHAEKPNEFMEAVSTFLEQTI